MYRGENKGKRNFDVINKYRINRSGVEYMQLYDWIGNEEFYGLYPVEVNGKIGFVDSDGKKVIQTIYDPINHEEYSSELEGNDEFIALKKNGLIGILKHDGTVVYDFCLHDVCFWNMQENLLPIFLNSKWGYLSLETMKIKIEPNYDSVCAFHDGYAAVRVGRFWGIIDANGNMIIEPKLNTHCYFSDGFAVLYETDDQEKIDEEDVKAESNGATFRMNCKIINLSCDIILSGYRNIKREDNNEFFLTSKNYEYTHVKLERIPSYVLVVEKNTGEIIKKVPVTQE